MRILITQKYLTKQSCDTFSTIPNPGDVILDGFCGTGMAGVAANRCEYPEPDFQARIEHDMPEVRWGRRYPILNDLSPIATLISRNYNADVDVSEFEREAERILQETREECGWMYETDPDPSQALLLQGDKGEIQYTVWSDVYICPHCGKRRLFFTMRLWMRKPEKLQMNFRAGAAARH